MRLKLFSALALALLAMPAAAQAQEPLIFKPLSAHARQADLTRYVRFSLGDVDTAALRAADVDLNNDGLFEVIVRLPDNSARILALPSGQPVILLGSLSPFKGIQASDEQDFGVRRLIASGSPSDDFSRRAYRWNPYEQLYERAE